MVTYDLVEIFWVSNKTKVASVRVKVYYYYCYYE